MISGFAPILRQGVCHFVHEYVPKVLHICSALWFGWLIETVLLMQLVVKDARDLLNSHYNYWDARKITSKQFMESWKLTHIQIVTTLSTAFRCLSQYLFFNPCSTHLCAEWSQLPLPLLHWIKNLTHQQYGSKSPTLKQPCGLYLQSRIRAEGLYYRLGTLHDWHLCRRRAISKGLPTF